MPKGSNLRGPLYDANLGRGVLADYPCKACSENGPKIYSPVKVDGQGNLIANCPKSRCGYERKAKTVKSARMIALEATNWKNGNKKRVFAALGLIDVPEVVIDQALEQVNEGVAPEPESVPEPELVPEPEPLPDPREIKTKKKLFKWSN